MTKEEIQKAWDRLLLTGWRHEWSMAGVKANAYKEIKGLDRGTDVDWGKVDSFLDSCNLKRCETFLVGKIPVRTFVESRCPNLSGCLWSGKYSNDELLEAIDRFKWKPLSEKQRQKYSQRKQNRKRKINREEKSTVFIKARELVKKSDWKTAK